MKLVPAALGVLLIGCGALHVDGHSASSSPKAERREAASRSATAKPASGEAPSVASPDGGPNAEAVALGRACFAAYAEFRHVWSPIEAKTRAAIDSTAGKSIYEALPVLRALYVGLEPQARQLKLSGASLQNAIDDGIAYEVALAVVALQKRTHHRERQLFRPGDFPRGHAATGDDSFDRDHYCARASYLGTHLAGPSGGYTSARIDTPWLSATAAKKFYDAETALLAKTNEEFAYVDKPVKESEWGVVKTIKRQDGGATVTLAHSEEETKCVRTNRIRRVHDNGVVEYDTDCSKVPTAWKYDVVVRIADAPALQVGDYVVVVGKRLGAKEGFDAPLVSHWSRGKQELFEYKATK